MTPNSSAKYPSLLLLYTTAGTVNFKFFGKFGSPTFFLAIFKQSVIADHQLPPVAHLLSEPCLRAEPGKMLALVVGCSRQ
jgi:hypothetical protein